MYQQKVMGSISNRQKGAVLAVSLIILLILTVIVLSSSQTVLMQEKMSAAIRDGGVSLSAAESGMKEAEALVEGLTGTSGFTNAGTGGYYTTDNGPADVFASAVWLPAITLEATTTNTKTGNNVRYFVEDLDIISVPEEDLSGVNMTGYGETTGGGDVNAFRVVVRATGSSGTAERFVEGYYGKRL